MTNIEIFDREYFNAEATITCGQTFRFFPHDGGYIILSLDKKCYIKSYDNITQIESDSLPYFINYFDLNRDYRAALEKLLAFPELVEGIRRASRGIHILRQDPFEMIISFIISQNNNIPRIRGIIEAICSSFGQKIDDEFYAFPTPKALASATIQDFKGFGAGYRAEYLFLAAKALEDGKLVATLINQSYDEAIKTLMDLKGIGRKVADCIALFALGHMCCYPVDTWIVKADGLPNEKPESVARRGRERYRELAGLAQQYRFHNIRQQ